MDVRDHEAGGSWMTYREIAAARRVKLTAAVRLVQRHKWRKQTGNDGTARILVPIEWTQPSDRVPPDVVDDVVTDADDDVADDVTHDRRMLAGALAALEAALMEANKRADAAQVLAERTLAELAEQRDAADRARARAHALHGTIEELRAGQAMMAHELEEARAKAQAAQDTAETLRQAEAERKARGLVARLRAAWRRE